MDQAITEFRVNISRSRQAIELAARVRELDAGADPSDLLRYSLASAVSAVDRYIHFICELGMLEAQAGYRPQTPSYRAFRVAMSSVHAALTLPPDPNWFVAQIRAQHTLKSFQKSSNIHEAINLFESIDIWALVAKALRVRVKDLRLDFDLYIERRNAIVHQADIDPTLPGSLTPLAESTARAAISLIEEVIGTMHATLIDITDKRAQEQGTS